MTPEKRLEQYTLLHPQELLLISVEMEGNPDQLMIFKGFSSSLMQATNTDPDQPLLTDHSQIIAIDRISSPYQPNNPHYLQQGLSWGEMDALLRSVGI